MRFGLKICKTINDQVKGEFKGNHFSVGFNDLFYIIVSAKESDDTLLLATALSGCFVIIFPLQYDSL